MAYPFLSLRYRIVLSVVLIEAVMLSVMVWSNVTQTRQTHLVRLQQSAAVILDQFSANTARYMFELDYPSLEEYANRVLAYKELSYFLVEDISGKPIAAGGNVPVQTSMETGNIDPATGLLNLRAEVVLAGATYGRVYLGFTTDMMEAAAAGALRRGMLIAAVEIVLSVVVALLLGFFLTRNLAVLARFAERFGAGERDISVPITAADETGLLAQAFNDMVDQHREDEQRRWENETRIRRLREEIGRASRTSEMGQLSSQIAHEINQPLTAIMNYVRTSRRMIEVEGVQVPEQALEMLDKAITQTERAARIVRQIREFVTRDEPVRVESDINELVRETVELAVESIAHDSPVVRWELAPELPPVMVDRAQIQQVLFNLVRNAVDAMSQTPRKILTIRTTREGLGMIEVSVSDTGSGLSGDTRKNLFEPFVTTKTQGMGLGLSISQSIVEAHGGRIEAAANQGDGETFRFTLPVISR